MKNSLGRWTLVIILFVSLWNCNGGTELPPVVDKKFEVLPGGEKDPVASEKAVKGGSISTWGAHFPKSLNYWTSPTSMTGEFMAMLYEPLASVNSTTDEVVGGLAASWESSKDNLTFTFKIHPSAVWSDGKPVTAEDVQFYYDVIMNKKNLTPVFRVDMVRFNRPEIVDQKTVKIVAKDKHWLNFWNAAGFFAFPKHAWKGKDFNKINFKFPVVNGPYEIKSLKKNAYLLLKRRGDWWGRAQKYNQGKYNFDYIRWRFVGDRNKAMEVFRKGRMDLYSIYTSSIWARRTNFKQVKKNWIVRQEVFNDRPKGFQGFAVNLRRPIFQDIRVRQAMAYVLNRQAMNEKFMYNEYFILNSYFPDLYPNNLNPGAELVKFNPEKARKLLDQAGWKVGEDGILAKDGKQFRIKFLSYNPDRRHTELFINDLKKVGIVATIDQTSMATATQRVKQRKFDLIWRNWGASRFRDPESLWHSNQADKKGSYNLPGYKNPKVDAIIKKLETESNLSRRNGLLRKMDALLLKESPYILLWQANKSRLLYWNKYGTPRNILGRFGDEANALVYWWADKEKAKALKAAMSGGSSLPAAPKTLKYAE